MKKKLLALFLCCALSFGLVTAALITPAAADSELMIYSENVAVDTVSVPKMKRRRSLRAACPATISGRSRSAATSGRILPVLPARSWKLATHLWRTCCTAARRTSAAASPAQPKSRYTPTPSRCRSRTKRPSPLRRRLQGPHRHLRGRAGRRAGHYSPQTVEETPAPDAAPANDLTANVAPAALADPAPVNDPAPSDNGGEEPYTQTFTITINYVDNNDQQVADPWTATVMAGGTYQSVVKSPVVVGYTADQAEITVGGENIQQDQNFTVKYKPTVVKFSVKHLLQNVSNDEYTQDGDPRSGTVTPETQSAKRWKSIIPAFIL